MFAAAVASSSVRESFIDSLHGYLTNNLAGLGDVPFAVLYDPHTANELVTSSDTGGMARLVLTLNNLLQAHRLSSDSFAQGAIFAPLALK